MPSELANFFLAKLAKLLQIHVHTLNITYTFLFSRNLENTCEFVDVLLINHIKLQMYIHTYVSYKCIYLRKCIFVKYRAAIQARPNDAFLWNRLGASLGNIFTPTYILTDMDTSTKKMVEILKIHTIGWHSLPAFMKSFIHTRNGHRPMQ